ncbi:MAG: hypothetical protein HQL07_11675 [Nitrospirae bacterium]|nr:hypothetical protein [Magnetococcales bacterium]
MGFKTKDWPCLEVQRSSGASCLAFEEKKNFVPAEKGRGSDDALDSSESPKGFSRIV